LKENLVEKIILSTGKIKKWKKQESVISDEILGLHNKKMKKVKVTSILLKREITKCTSSNLLTSSQSTIRAECSAFVQNSGYRHLL
jgi:hypothetical protein